MEIVGKVIQVFPLQGGTNQSTGKSWQVETFIIETLENYPRKVAIEVFGEKRIQDNPVEVDKIYTISFDLESREFNGRWYTSARAWKIVEGQPNAQQPGAPLPQAAPQAAPAAPPQMPQQAPLFEPEGESTDLPF